MNLLHRRGVLRAAALFPLVVTPAAAQGNDPLPSWRDTAPKRAILDFAAAVTAEGTPGFVAPADRIAVFDNDGTLWVEQPIYPQFAYALDRLKAMAQRNPSWKQEPLFRAALAGDMKTVLASGSGGLQRLIGAALAGNTPEESARLAQAWLAQAKDPKWGKPYTALVYQPMIEIIGQVKSRPFEDESRAAANLTPGFGFATTGALLDGIGFNRLKLFPLMFAGIAFVVVGGHAPGS